MKNCKRPSHFVRASCWDAIVKKGWHPHRRGFPTYLAFSDDGQIAFIESHPKRAAYIQENQRLLFQALTAAGFQCLSWHQPSKSFTLFSLDPSPTVGQGDIGGMGVISNPVSPQDLQPLLRLYHQHIDPRLTLLDLQRFLNGRPSQPFVEAVGMAVKFKTKSWPTVQRYYAERLAAAPPPPAPDQTETS